MIPIQHRDVDLQTQIIASEYHIPFPFSNSPTNLVNPQKLILKSKQIQKKTHTRRKYYIYGDKDRSSALYKYIKEHQRSYQDLNNKTQKSTISPEEDRILLLLVKKLGPKFQKIAKYFPGKTMNMLKNHYYKSLKNQEASIIPKEIEEELALIDKQKRIIGKKIIKIWPQEQRISAIIEKSELFPEAKEKIQVFIKGFTQIITNLLNNK